MWPFVVGGASCFVFTRRPLPELSQRVVLLTCYGRGGEGGEQEEEDGDGRPLTAGHDLGPQGRPCPVGSPPPREGHHQPGARGGSDRIPPCSRSGPYRALMGPLCLGRAGSGHHRTELWPLESNPLGEEELLPPRLRAVDWAGGGSLQPASRCSQVDEHCWRSLSRGSATLRHLPRTCTKIGKTFPGKIHFWEIEVYMMLMVL